MGETFLFFVNFSGAEPVGQGMGKTLLQAVSCSQKLEHKKNKKLIDIPHRGKIYTKCIEKHRALLQN